MKKKLTCTLAALAAVVMLCGFKYSYKENGDIPTGGEEMRILHYHGHSYICYRFYNRGHGGFGDGKYGWGYGGASIEHDPDCNCGKGGGR